MSSPDVRWSLRDLPVPAKLVLSTFLLSVGLGYMWALAQIHFKHASPGEKMPTIPDIVSRFSGVPWPLEEKPKDEVPAEAASAPEAKNEPVGAPVTGIKIKTVIEWRCATCHGEGGEKEEIRLDTFEKLAKYLEPTANHPKGKLHRTITNEAGRAGGFNKDNMVKAFFEKTDDWPKMPGEKQQKALRRGEVERQALAAWIEAGAPESAYKADAFPLVDPAQSADVDNELKTMAAPLAKKPATEVKKAGPDKWKIAKGKQLSVEALTQSTHAHLLTFSILWAATGLVFAFTSYSIKFRCLVAPIVLIAQVADVGCWWFARLEGIGPYFALAILATGGVVGLGLGLQIMGSLFNMWGGKGRAVLVVLFAIGAGAGGLVKVKVLDPLIESEKAAAVNGG